MRSRVSFDFIPLPLEELCRFGVLSSPSMEGEVP
jgi:hypothetical protein